MIRTVLAALLFMVLQTTAPPSQVPPWPREVEHPDALEPKEPPQRWLGLIGEYGDEAAPLYILESYGYGLLIHDGYRPWYVTQTFWDATPLNKKWLVANPATGSRHNRGAAVDLTLYDLKTGRAVEMPSTYDESTTRAYAFYPGGTDAEVTQ